MIHAPLLVITGMVSGALMTLAAIEFYERRDALVRTLASRLRVQTERAELFERNASIAHEKLMDWRLKALNAQYALDSLQRIHRDPIARHEVELRLGDGVWDSLPVNDLLREVA